MSAYGAVLSANFRTLLQYRAAAIAGFTTQIFWGLIRVMIFEAFFRSSSAAQPMTMDEVATYIWLGQAFIMLLPWNIDREIHNLIRSGFVGSYRVMSRKCCSSAAANRSRSFSGISASSSRAVVQRGSTPFQLR